MIVVSDATPINALAQIGYIALELGADLLLVDDKGARAARRMGMRFIGTVGVLELAASNALISVPDAIVRLRQTDFRIAQGLLEAALARDAQRKGQSPPVA